MKKWWFLFCVYVLLLYLVIIWKFLYIFFVFCKKIAFISWLSQFWKYLTKFVYEIQCSLFLIYTQIYVSWYTCTYIYIRIHVDILIYIHTYVYTCIFTYVYVYIYVPTYIHMHTHYVHTYIYLSICIYRNLNLLI
jgi:hypothetical protein